MSRDHCLPGLAFSAIRRSPKHPALLVGNGIAGIPELRRYASVGRSSDHFSDASVLYPVAFFGVELEVVPLLVDAPTIVCNHKVSVASIFDHLVIVPVSRFETDVGHSDYWKLVVFGSHTSIASALANSGGGFSGHEISHELSILDRELSLGHYSLIIVAEGSQSVSMVEGCIHYNVHVF